MVNPSLFTFLRSPHHAHRNKFCFTGGYVETSVQLPGINNVVGLWPAVWTMGNLGRAGYGASLEGMVCFVDYPHFCIDF
jgi:beta-glucanase (GH16 family)